MSMTQLDCVTRTRDALAEATARQWSDNQLRKWINDAVRDIARTTECFETTATVAITANTQTYSLSAITPPIARIHRVEFVMTGDTRVYPLDYEDYGNLDYLWGSGKTTQRSRPEIWTAWGASPAITALLYPTPSTNGTLTLYYYSIPVKLSESGTSDNSTLLSIPEGWEDLITDYAEWKALRRDRDPRWQEAKQLYDEALEKMMGMTSRHSDQAGKLVPSGNGSIPGWLAEGW